MKYILQIEIDEKKLAMKEFYLKALIRDNIVSMLNMFLTNKGQHRAQFKLKELKE